MPKSIEQQLNNTIAELSVDPKKNRQQLRFLKSLKSKAQEEEE